MIGHFLDESVQANRRRAGEDRIRVAGDLVGAERVEADTGLGEVLARDGGFS